MDRRLGSCKADGYLSIVETLQFFNRKQQSCVTDEDKHKVDCSRAKECKSQVADLIIVLDRSGSLSDHYNKLVDAAVELIKALDIGENNVHVGVVSFSGEFGSYDTGVIRNVQRIVHLGKDFDKKEIVKKVENMKDKGPFERTFTGDALKKVKTILEGSIRFTVLQAIVLITDGQSTDPKVLFDVLTRYKMSGVTIFCVGVNPPGGYLNMDELKMMTAPESDKNLMILEDFDQLKPWAQNFSMRLCVELKPINPKFCDADVQFKSISACIENKMQETLVNYKYDDSRKCIKQFKNSIIQKCKGTCVDPIDGSDHLQGESWVNLCHQFSCHKAGSPTLPAKSTKCVAADYSCKPIGSAPFQCRNIDGELRDNCQCVDKGGEAVLVVDNPNSA